jgi:hypothetical protein
MSLRDEDPVVFRPPSQASLARKLIHYSTGTEIHQPTTSYQYTEITRPKCIPASSSSSSVSYSCCSHSENKDSVKRFVSLLFLNLRQSVGLLGRGISPSQGRYQHEDRINTKRQPYLRPRGDYDRHSGFLMSVMGPKLAISKA